MDSKSKEYWNSRIQDVYDEIYDRKTIRKIYRKAYYDVEADIKSLYDSLKDTGDISTTKLYQFERFISLKKELKNQAKYVKSTLDNEVTKTLTQAYKDTFDTVSHMVGKDRTWGIQNDKMVEAAVHKKWQGANFSERIWKDTDELARDVKAAITDCITRGVSKDVYVKQIMKQYNAGFSKADRLVRTELMHTINTAQIETYKMDGVTKVEWYTADDERVCSDCGSMHGRIFDIKEVGNDVEVIAHPNCRCTYLPVVDDIESIEFQTDTVDNSGKSGIIKVDNIVTGHSSTPKNAKPNSIIDHKKDGRTDVRTFYNEKGLKSKDINTNSHGNSKHHPYGKNGEHAHDYEWDNGDKLKNRTTRELTEKEREENADIL